MAGRAKRQAVQQQTRCPRCHSPKVRQAWGTVALLAAGIICLIAGAVSAVLILLSPDGQSRLILSLILVVAGIASLVKWSGFRGRAYFRCLACSHRWTRERGA